jgi:hypothetical protein
MKKAVINSLIFIVLLAITSSGCKKDDEKSNFLKVDDSRHRLGSGCLVNSGPIEGFLEGYLYYLYFASPGIEINQDGVPISGSGQVIGFRCVSSSLIGLETGEYVFDETSYPLPFLSFYSSNYSLDWTYGGDTDWTKLVSGVVNVINNNDNNYEMTIDCEDENGDQVTGYFKGLFIYSCPEK